MLNFIKNWTLPIAMLAGVLGYLLFVHVPLLEPTKPLVNQLIAFLTPSLIFAQLFVLARYRLHLNRTRICNASAGSVKLSVYYLKKQTLPEECKNQLLL